MRHTIWRKCESTIKPVAEKNYTLKTNSPAFSVGVVRKLADPKQVVHICLPLTIARSKITICCWLFHQQNKSTPGTRLGDTMTTKVNKRKVYFRQNEAYQLKHITSLRWQFGTSVIVNKSFQATWSDASNNFVNDARNDSAFCFVCCKTVKDGKFGLSPNAQECFLFGQTSRVFAGVALKRTSTPNPFPSGKRSRIYQRSDAGVFSSSDANWCCGLSPPGARHLVKSDPGASFFYRQTQALAYPTAKLCHSASSWDRQLARYVPPQHSTDRKPRSYSCNKCEAMFATASDLVLHLPTHPNESLFECKFCRLLFTKEQYLVNHALTHAV